MSNHSMAHQTIERYCIIGTAPSWKKTPWNDTGLHLESLNDGYRMQGFVRADSWLDIHPLDKFYHPPLAADGKMPTQVFAHQVPPGYYVRPADHKEWLARQSQTIPVWLNERYLEQDPSAASWPKARAFPRSEIEDYFGEYFMSTPALMVGHAIMRGAKEIHIYGIHLATEREYVDQRPNFEFLCGRVLGPSKAKMTEKDGLRRWETKDGLIVLPVESPILTSSWQYAKGVRPGAGDEILKWDVHRYGVKHQRALTALRDAGRWTPKRPLQEALVRSEAFLADAQEQLQRANLVQQMGGW